MRYVCALLIGLAISVMLLFSLVQLRSFVDDRTEFLLATEQETAAGEELLLRIASALANYGYLLILPIMGVCLYLAKRFSRSAATSRPD